MYPNVQVTANHTPDGVAYDTLSPLATGPSPTLLLLAKTGNFTLSTESHGRMGVLLHAQGWNVASLDLPCHGVQQRASEPAELSGWAARTSHGENIADEFCSRVNQVLEHLVKTGVAAPERIAAAGTSRGGFMAFQAAAVNPRIRAIAGFSPVTDLLALSEFSGLQGNALVEKLALVNLAEKLADRATWIMIGNQDERVGTERATTFAKALILAAETQKLKTRVELQVVPVPGHRSLPEWHDQAAAWLLSALKLPFV